MEYVLFWFSCALALAAFVVGVAYLTVRAASIAYFRTKLAYWRSIIREGAKSNGQE